MARFYFIAACLSFFSCSPSSTEFDIKDSEVPPGVMAAFKAKYPQAQDVKWEADKENGKFYFEADFKDGGKEKEVLITPDGSSITEGD
jgi:hypothetical protein